MIVENIPKVYGYARRSRDIQILSLEVQCDRIRQRAEREGWEVDQIFQETESGKEVPCMKRPEFVACWNALRPDDTLIVWQLRRIDRDAARLISAVDALVKRGVRIVVLEMMGQDIDFSTPLGQLICAVMAYFAKFEEEGRIEAIKGGLGPLRQGWLRYRIGTLPPGWGRRWEWTKVPAGLATQNGGRYRDQEVWDENECNALKEIWIRYHRLHQTIVEIGRIFKARREKRAEGHPWVHMQRKHTQECRDARPPTARRPEGGWGCYLSKPCKKYPDYQAIRRGLHWMDELLQSDDIPPPLRISEGVVAAFMEKLMANASDATA